MVDKLRGVVYAESPWRAGALERQIPNSSLPLLLVAALRKQSQVVDRLSDRGD